MLVYKLFFLGKKENLGKERTAKRKNLGKERTGKWKRKKFGKLWKKLEK